MDIYGRIKDLCRARNISISALESACGLGKKTIANWDKSSPSVDKLAKVADYFGVTVDSLLGREEHETDSYGEIRDALDALRQNRSFSLLLSAGDKLKNEDLDILIAMAKRMMGE